MTADLGVPMPENPPPFLNIKLTRDDGGRLIEVEGICLFCRRDRSLSFVELPESMAITCELCGSRQIVASLAA